MQITSFREAISYLTYVYMKREEKVAEKEALDRQNALQISQQNNQAMIEKAKLAPDGAVEAAKIKTAGTNQDTQVTAQSKENIETQRAMVDLKKSNDLMKQHLDKMEVEIQKLQQPKAA